MSTRYIALLADASASRLLPPARRARLQADLRAVLPELNRRYRRALAARFAVTLGDELQGLLASAAPLWEITHFIRARLPAVDWVAACGRGTISTPLARTAPEIDGPCFHAARAALDRAKRQRLVLAFGEFPPALDPLASYYSALYWSWTSRQRHAATLLRLGSAQAAADHLKVHRSAISHLARRMAWPLVERGDKMLRALLETS
jgi:SatD family protein